MDQVSKGVVLMAIGTALALVIWIGCLIYAGTTEVVPVWVVIGLACLTGIVAAELEG